nr:transposase [Sphingobacterium sp.]
MFDWLVHGFKLHLIINDKGEILSFYLTKGNVDDRNLKYMMSMAKDIFIGVCQNSSISKSSLKVSITFVY